jgi:hypothetical protein
MAGTRIKDMVQGRQNVEAQELDARDSEQVGFSIKRDTFLLSFA